MAAFRNLRMMMTRVKSRPLPPLVSKRTLENQDKFGQACLQSLAVLSAASCFGILVAAQKVGVNFPICLSISMVIAVLSGLGLAEFLTAHTQRCHSVYSCLYQSVSEIIAYIVGWTWILSLSATLAAICKALSSLVDDITNQQVSSFIRNNMSPSCPDILSLALMVTLAVLSITGISYMSCWLATSMSFTLLLTVAIAIGYSVIADKSEWMPIGKIYQTLRPEELLTGATLCFTIFLGPHSALRLPVIQIHRSVGKVLGLFNVFSFIITLICGSLLIFTLYQEKDIGQFLSDRQVSRILAISTIVPLALLAFEHYQPLLAVVQDMSTDGLLFRCLSKKWKPFCENVPTLWMFFLTTVLTGILTLMLSSTNALKVAATAHLFINTVVSITVLVLRYKYCDAWQYEPMLQNGSASHHHSHKRSTEFLPSTDLSSPNEVGKATDNSDSDESSGTDIDTIVQEYKESIQMSNLNTLESAAGKDVIQEPTSSSSFQAKLLIFAHVINCCVLAISLTIAARAKMTFDIVLVCVVSLTFVLSVIFLGLLQRLPQNKPSSKIRSGKTQTFVPLVPWTPGLAVLLLLCLLIHVLIDVWHVVLGWSLLGVFLYLVYGMRNSTAATSFYGIPLSARLSLQPFPLPREGNIRQVTLPEKKRKKKARRIIQ